MTELRQSPAKLPQFSDENWLFVREENTPSHVMTQANGNGGA
jgi:hypothetical protein